GFNNDGAAAVTRLFSPAGVSVDPFDGSVIIADTGNHRVRRLTAAGMIVTLAGTGADTYTGDGMLATASALNNPTSAVVHPA
ncbi:hypothetical protein OFC55_39905, partial [Escherichia coli]|nr:hypothetical protein [Escherichia coli]